jgi:hypothetical protein
MYKGLSLQPDLKNTARRKAEEGRRNEEEVEKESPECSQKTRDRDAFLLTKIGTVLYKRMTRRDYEKSRKNLFITILIVSLPSALKITEEVLKTES